MNMIWVGKFGLWVKTLKSECEKLDDVAGESGHAGVAMRPGRQHSCFSRMLINLRLQGLALSRDHSNCFRGNPEGSPLWAFRAATPERGVVSPVRVTYGQLKSSS